MTLDRFHGRWRELSESAARSTSYPTGDHWCRRTSSLSTPRLDAARSRHERRIHRCAGVGRGMTAACDKRDALVRLTAIERSQRRRGFSRDAPAIPRTRKATESFIRTSPTCASDIYGSARIVDSLGQSEMIAGKSALLPHTNQSIASCRTPRIHHKCDFMSAQAARAVTISGSSVPPPSRRWEYSVNRQDFKRWRTEP